MPTKTWECEWKEHHIKVENHWNFLLQTRERLFINGKLADENQGWVTLEEIEKMATPVTLTGVIKDNDKAFPVKVLIGLAKLGLTVDCKIWVDSELVYPETL